MKNSEVLDRAADLIEKRGWTKEGFGHAESGICVETALVEVLLGAAIYKEEQWTTCVCSTANAHPAGKALLAFVEAEHLHHWNDKDCMTKGQVLAALRGAAEVERSKEAEVEAAVVVEAESIVRRAFRRLRGRHTKTEEFANSV